MRTTLTLPDDVHEYIRERAHRQRQTMSEVVVQLLRQAQQGSPASTVISQSARGVPVLSVGRHITSDDVLSLEDDIQ